MKKLPWTRIKSSIYLSEPLYKAFTALFKVAEESDAMMILYMAVSGEVRELCRREAKHLTDIPGLVSHVRHALSDDRATMALLDEFARFLADKKKRKPV
jgi:hypothetical protein